jgi:hypothetical protein
VLNVVEVDALPNKVAVIALALKLPALSLKTIVLPTFDVVALEVTVNVAGPELVYTVEPDKPLPEVVRVNEFERVPEITPAYKILLLASYSKPLSINGL